MAANDMPFQGIPTFLKSGFAPAGAADRPLGFLGLPYDCATTFRPGARMGPDAIRRASKMLTDGKNQNIHPNVDAATLVSDLGDAAITHVQQDDALGQIETAVAALLDRGYHPVIAGGDHLTTLGVLRALHKKHGQMALFHFDAHHDCWDSHFGDRIGHGTWVRNAVEEGLVNPNWVTQIGIRSPSDDASAIWLGRRGGKGFSAREAMRKDPYDIMADHARRTGRTPGNPARVPTYISFDIDALDPAHAPGTGTPEIGGLTSMWAMEMLEYIVRYQPGLVGMDVVEVAPAYDHGEITALAAATMLWTYCSGQPHLRSF